MNHSPPAAPIYRDIVLIGGGHAHVQVLKILALRPIGNTRITLISDVRYAPYSGMLPGHLAGHYTFEEVHFDLQSLCAKANARFIHSAATRIDTSQQIVACAQHAAVAFDKLSINIGCSPNLPDNIDFQHTLPMKPISSFLTKWHALIQYLEESQKHSTEGSKIAVVGGGAAGIEIAMILQKKLGEKTASSVDLFQAAPNILPSHPNKTQRKLKHIAKQAGINLYLKEKVKSFHNGRITTAKGNEFACDRAIWATQAAAPPWLAQTNLPTDAHGFIKVGHNLQVEANPNIFAAGDCIAFPTPLEKSGVYAVREGEILAHNVRAAMLDQPLATYIPQKNFLSLITAGEQIAYASKGVYLGSGHLWWRVKDHIDRKFMTTWQDYSSIKSS